MSRPERTLRSFTLVSVALAAILLGTSASASAGTLDQQQPTIGGTALFANSTQSLAQTFTAGITGVVDEADLALSNFNSPSLDLIVQIRDGSAAGAGNQVLASGNVPASSVGNPAFVAVALNPPASVVAGQQYAIVAYSSAVFPNNYAWSQAGGDPYPRGAPFTNTSSPPSGSWTAASGDFAFKTYVVPSPGTSGLTGQRAAALASCKKRAHKHHWSHRRLKKCKKKANLLPV